MTDHCELHDLPRDQCAHCGAAPGTSFEFLRWRTVVTGARSVDELGNKPMPTAMGKLLGHALGSHTSGSTCQACGRPTRNDAYGCDACADKLRRTFADAPWWAEQIEITMTKQRGKRPGAGGGPSATWYRRTTADGEVIEESALAWRDDAADLGWGLRNHLVTTVRLCVEESVRHSSPYVGLPEDTPDAIATWLLWRVDGLTLSPAFGEILADAERFEKLAEWLIDRRPDRVFLGKCRFAVVCGGVVYAKPGEKVATCRACGEQYDAGAKRDELEKALDDRLMTAAEIATCATYLGIDSDRDVVRKRVNRWHNAGVIKPATWVVEDEKKPEERTPRFRYGDVAPKLAATYEKG